MQFGPKPTIKKYWQNLNLAVASQVHLTSLKQHCHISLEVLEQSHEFTNLNWQHASTKLATSTARIDGHWMGPRVLVHALCHYMLRTK